MPPVNTSATGLATFTLAQNWAEMNYYVRVADIGSISGAHVHRALEGKTGPIVHELFSGSGTFNSTRPISGSFALTSADLADLLSRMYYVNIRTSQRPSGEIRAAFGPRLKYQSFMTMLLNHPIDLKYSSFLPIIRR